MADIVIDLSQTKPTFTPNPFFTPAGTSFTVEVITQGQNPTIELPPAITVDKVTYTLRLGNTLAPGTIENISCSMQLPTEGEEERTSSGSIEVSGQNDS